MEARRNCAKVPGSQVELKFLISPAHPHQDSDLGDHEKSGTLTTRVFENLAEGYPIILRLHCSLT
jgi:hypothetical protein